MSRWNPIERIKNADKCDAGKWLCIIGAGILTLFAGLFDTKVKDRQYEKKMGETIEKQANRLLEKWKSEG